MLDEGFGIDWGAGEDEGDRLRFPFVALHKIN